ncbi:hypothetical protein K439DRAFT_710769 [Ramaria rubella]|nr:hypothetical protein K439DRAFT_710769 [Ramaria rubella]
MFRCVLIAWMTLTILVRAHVVPQQRSTSGLIRPPNDCNAIDSPYDGAQCPSCLCTNESIILLGEQALCFGTDLCLGENLHMLLDLADWCRELGFPIENSAFQLLPNQTVVLDNYKRADEDLRTQQTVFLTFQIAGGHVGLVLLVVISLLVRTIRRDLIYFNFCVKWVISSVVFSLALYQDISTHSITFPLSPQWSVFVNNGPYIRQLSSTACDVQAALLNGVQPMTAFSTLALISKLWFDLHISIYSVGMKAQWIPWVKAF